MTNSTFPTVDNRPRVKENEFPWPLWNLVVIEVDDAFRGTVLAIPDSVRAESIENSGTVIAVGPGQLLDDGTIRPVAVEMGQRVYFRKYRGAAYEKGKYWIAPDTELVGVIGRPDDDPRVEINMLKAESREVGFQSEKTAC